MCKWTLVVLPPAVAIAPFAGAQPPKKADEPKPGARGNADNVPHIGKSDPKGNPVRRGMDRGDS